MAYKGLIVALGMISAGSPLSATQIEPVEPGIAPAADPEARYCMKIEITGSRIEEVKCWTRAKWADEEVDLDKEWAREGVAIIDGGVRRPAVS